MIGKLPSKTAMVRPTMAEVTVLREATTLALAAMTGTTGATAGTKATAGTGNNSSRAATLVDTTRRRRPANDRYYRERSDSATVLDVEFPALPVAASARAAALASASTPTPAEGSAPASA
ncbi:hypothetical protein PVAP13_9KG014520 [Panicum virgatum]|uniref:Uncharacterized protein n=1 Tax=Panicum virgatum TaxID=38727 RepID=A0A8T0N6R6_PANVG|nr:hypothetical protein PVAP13_9KG014520 [Panicum virgatum]